MSGNCESACEAENLVSGIYLYFVRQRGSWPCTRLPNFLHQTVFHSIAPMTLKRLALASIVTALLASAQYQRRGSAGPKNSPVPLPYEVPADFKGVIKSISGSKILIELPDENILEFRATKKTAFQIRGAAGKLKDLAPGQKVEIEGRHSAGAIEAVTVKVQTPA